MPPRMEFGHREQNEEHYQPVEGAEFFHWASDYSLGLAEPREVSTGLVTGSGCVGGPPPLSPKWRKRSANQGVANIRTIVPITSTHSIRASHVIARLDGR